MPSFTPKTIHLSSKYANGFGDGTRGKCTFQLSRPINIPAEYEVHLALLSAVIPVSWYGIPTNTTIVYTVGGVNTNWIIPAGNWSGPDVAAKLTTTNINVTFTQQTGLFTFKNLVSSTIITIPISPILGTTSAKTLPSINATVNSDVFPDIFGTRFVNITSSINTENITAGTVPAGSGIISSVPVNVAPGSFIVFGPNNLVQNKLRETSLQDIDITLCDSSMTQLNMNGCDWEIDLLLSVLIDDNADYTETPKGNLFSATKQYHPKSIK